jgi:hypothetical protein
VLEWKDREGGLVDEGIRNHGRGSEYQELGQ